MAEFSDISQLTDGARVRVRLAKRDNEAGDAPDWHAPIEVTLHVQRRAKTIKRGREVYAAGEISVLAIKHSDWAEYSEKDYSPEFKTFLIEEYRMQILEVL